MKLLKIMLCMMAILWLAACSNVTQPNPGNPAINDINAALNQAATANQKVAEQAKLQVPADVSNALLPSLNVADTQKKTLNEKRFNITVNNVSAQSFFAGLIKGTKYNMVVSPKITGTISLNLKNVTIDETLQAIHDNYGYEYKKSSYGYQIVPAGLQTRIFAVNYLDISRTGESDTRVSAGQISSKIAGGGAVASTTNPASSVVTKTSSQFWKELSETLDAIVGTANGRKVVLNPNAGIVIIKAFPNEISQVAKYLDSLQSSMTRQVIIEAKILEVNLSTNYKAGIDWTVLGMHQGAATTVAGTAASLAENLPGFSSIFSVDAHIGRSFKAIINMISAQGNVQILSSPRIATLNNQKAVIKVGNDEFFITNVDATTTTGTATTTSQNVDLTPFFSGISLDVTPQISSAGDVILHIHPLISKVSQKDLTYTINDKTQSLPLATSKVRETDNIVMAKNGQIVVIGGLMENKTEEHTGSTPFISKVPIVGPLFRRNHQDSGKLELVILLRPIVVGNNTWTNRIRQTSMRMQSLNKGFHAGDHSEIFGNLAENFPKTESNNDSNNDYMK